MSTVDWDNAPKWTDRHGFAGMGRHPVWFNDHQYQHVHSGNFHMFGDGCVWKPCEIADMSSRPSAPADVSPAYAAPRIAAHEFLERGVSHMRDRAVQRDSEAGERSMARAVAAFNAQEGTNLTEAQGWRFMIQLKYARAVNGVFVADDYEDMAAYAGLAGEAAQG